MFDKSKFMEQTEKAIEEYSKGNITEQSLLRALQNYDLYQKQYNTFFEYLNAWFTLHNANKYPDLNKDNYKLIKYIVETELDSLKKDTFLSVGLSKDDLQILKNTASVVKSIYSNASKLENFLNKRSKVLYPNLSYILGPILAVRFINQAKSLKRLASLPASTIQLIGAENALFKHLKFGKKSPKYGLLYLHPLMSGLNSKQKGKLARYMADKISLASRFDYAGRPLHKELLEDIERKKMSLIAEKQKKRL